MSKSYKTICPNPACGSDNFYVTPHNGMGYCFSCKHVEKEGNAPKGRIKVRSENIAEIRGLYNEAAWYYHSSIDTTARSFLYSRGFTDKTINELQIGYCPEGTLPLYKNPIAKEAGLATKDNQAFLGGRITFPYFKESGIVTDIRARAIDPHAEIKYKSPFGDVYFRGAIYPYNYHLRHAKRILLTEGEIKADIALQHGFTTLALPGINAWRTGFTQDENQEVIIVFDNESNQKTRGYVTEAIRNIANELLHPKVAVLPILDGSTKAEIDTFINKHGAALFGRIIDNALDYKTWDSLQQRF